MPKQLGRPLASLKNKGYLLLSCFVIHFDLAKSHICKDVFVRPFEVCAAPVLTFTLILLFFDGKLPNDDCIVRKLAIGFFLIFPALDVIFHSPAWAAFYEVPAGVWQAAFAPAVPAFFRPPGADDPHPAGLPSW